MTPSAFSSGRRRRQQPEKTEQSHIVQTIALLGGKSYVLGTRRGTVRCINCGKQTPEHQGTKQTAGVSDVLAFLPLVNAPVGSPRAVLVFVEVKAARGRMSTEQQEFREWSLHACQAHVVGGFNAFADWLIERGICKETAFAHYRVASQKG